MHETTRAASERLPRRRARSGRTHADPVIVIQHGNGRIEPNRSAKHWMVLFENCQVFCTQMGFRFAVAVLNHDYWVWCAFSQLQRETARKSFRSGSESFQCKARATEAVSRSIEQRALQRFCSYSASCATQGFQAPQKQKANKSPLQLSALAPPQQQNSQTRRRISCARRARQIICSAEDTSGSSWSYRKSGTGRQCRRVRQVVVQCGDRNRDAPTVRRESRRSR